MYAGKGPKTVKKLNIEKRKEAFLDMVLKIILKHQVPMQKKVCTVGVKIYKNNQKMVLKFQNICFSLSMLYSNISKSTMCKLNTQKKWPYETSFTNEAYIITLGLPRNGSSFGIQETGVLCLHAGKKFVG